MFTLRALAGVVALAAVAGCNQQAPTSPPPPTVVPIQVVSLTISGLEGPLAAGGTASLRATAHMLDGTDFIVPDGAEWLSRDPEIARIDAQGALIAVREGATTIVAAVKGAEAELPVTVLMNLTGVWKLTFIPVSCPYVVIPGCLIRFTGRRPVTELVTLSQTVDRVSGEWLVPVQGRVALDGQVVLHGRQCYSSDHTGDSEIAVGWEMQRTSADSFSGRARWERYHTSGPYESCTGIRADSGIVGDLQVLDFRRAGQ